MKNLKKRIEHNINFYEQFKQLPKNEQFAGLKIHTLLFDLLTACRELGLLDEQLLVFIRSRLKGKKIESLEPYLSEFERTLKLGGNLQMIISEHEAHLKELQKIYETKKI